MEKISSISGNISETTLCKKNAKIIFYMQLNSMSLWSQMIIECHSKDFMFNKDFTMCTVKQCHEFACAHCAFFSSLWCTSLFSPQLFYRPNSKLCRFLLVCNLQHQKHRPMMIDQSLSYLIRAR